MAERYRVSVTRLIRCSYLLSLCYLYIIAEASKLDLPRCNPESYNERILDYSSATTRFDAPMEPRILTQKLNQSPKRHLGIVNEGFSLVFAKKTLFYIDTSPAGEMSYPGPKVWALDMEEQSNEIFDSQFDLGSAFCETDMNLPSIGEFNGDICYIFRLYQKPYPEATRFLVFDSENPRSLDASFDGRYTAWVEDSWISGLNSVVRIYDNVERALVVFPYEQLLEYFVNVEGISMENPKFCGNSVAFQVVIRTETQLRTYIYMYWVSTRKLDIVASNPDRYETHLEVSNIAEGQSESCYETGTCECYVTWFEHEASAIDLKMSEYMMNNNLTSLTNLSLHDFEKIRTLTPGDVSLNALHLPGNDLIQFNSTSWSTTDEVLHDTICAGHTLYSIVRNNDSTSFQLLEFSLLDSTRRTMAFEPVANATSSIRLEFEAASEVAMFYWEQSVDENNEIVDTLRMVASDGNIVMGVEYPNTHCVVFNASETATVSQVSLFHDTIIWVDETKTSSGKVQFDIKLMDYDKDGDGVFDPSDLFPVKYGYIYDSDGDGYADARDFVVRSDLGDDDVFMYIVWLMFVTIMTACVMGFVALRRSITASSATVDPSNNGDSAQKARSKTMVTANAEEIVHNLIRKSGFIIRWRNRLFNRRKDHNRSDGSDTGLTSNDLLLEKMNSVQTATEVFTTILTVTSMVIAVYPAYPFEGITPRTRYMYVWIDFFITTIFIIDVLVRFVIRDRKETPGLAVFLYHNWYDIPALLTDIPMTFVQLPDFLGLLKGFRAVRLYRRFTQQTIFVSIMVKRPFVYLTLFVAAVICSVAVALKILEQGDNEEYREIKNVLWFSIVTVTTVGYGEMASPKTVIGRILTVALMMTGIGLVSTLSAFTVANIVTIAKTEQKKKEMKEDLRHRWEQMRDGLVLIAEPYNPIACVISKLTEHESNLDHANDQKKKIAMKHRSSTLNIMVGMNTEIELPVDKVMQGAGGKFTVNTISSQAELIHSITKEHEQSMLLEVVRNNNQTRSNLMSPGTRLNFLLRRFQLHSAILNFDEMVQELADIMFEPPRPNGLYLAKIYGMICTIQKRREEEKALDYIELDYCDPINRKLSIIDEHFARYGVNSRNEYPELLSEVTKVLIMFDRVATVQWAVEHLEYKEDVTPPVPLLQEVRPPPARMPTSGVLLSDPAVEDEDDDE